MSRNQASVSQSWDRIESWVRANDPAQRIVFPPGASEAHIKKAEAVMGLRLPDDVRESYRRHDGSNEVWLFEQGFVLPLGGRNPAKEFMTVAGLWDKMQVVGKQMEGEKTEVKGPIRAGWWRPQWAPLTENWQGEFICVDLDPSKRGVVGQVFFLWACYRHHLAESWAAFLAQRAADLESGAYEVNEEGQIARTKKG